MIETEVNPHEVWAFYEQGVSRQLLEKVLKEGWKNIPRVPIFSIPGELRRDKLKFILMDGNHRRSVAEYMNSPLPVALYNFGERIDITAHKLANFRHHNDPNIYSTLMNLFRMEMTPKQPALI